MMSRNSIFFINCWKTMITRGINTKASIYGIKNDNVGLCPTSGLVTNFNSGLAKDKHMRSANRPSLVRNKDLILIDSLFREYRFIA